MNEQNNQEAEVVPAEEPKPQTDEQSAIAKPEKIVDSEAFAFAQKEKAERLARKLEALNSANKKAEQELKRTLALAALKSNGIDDEELASILAREIAQDVKLNDDFAVVDSSYIEKAKKLASKVAKPKEEAKPVVALQPPSAKTEEPPTEWKARLKYLAKKI